jgi:hypothetical protein
LASGFAPNERGRITGHRKMTCRMVHYHLARPHEALREPVAGLRGKYRQRPPAMAV